MNEIESVDIHIGKNEASMKVISDGNKHLLQALVEMFDNAGAVNVLEMTCNHQTRGDFTITIQRQAGKTFGTLNAELKTQIDVRDKLIIQAQAQIRDLQDQLSEF